MLDVCLNASSFEASGLTSIASSLWQTCQATADRSQKTEVRSQIRCLSGRLLANGACGDTATYSQKLRGEGEGTGRERIKTFGIALVKPRPSTLSQGSPPSA